MEKSRKKAVEAEAIGSVLMRVLKRFKMDNSLFCSSISQKWKEIVGSAIGEHSKPVDLINGCLYVNVDSPVWLNELNLYMKKDILKKIRMINKDVKNVRFRIGPV